MQDSNQDITYSLISSLDINQRIGSIFPDSVILDTQFNIVSISQNILEATHYTNNELKGKSISIFSTTTNFAAILEDRLSHGYFEEQSFEVRCKDGGIIQFVISGFYMGLIADVNGLIILKFKNLDEVNLFNKVLAAKTNELDDFIYASAHSLRGPLATLKGLLNLAKTTKTQEEMDFLLQQISVFADRLDDKLHGLIYVAESDKTPLPDSESRSITTVVEKLSASIREASFDFPINFQCPIADTQQVFEKGELTFSMLNNLVLFFCHQQKTKENLLILDAQSSSSTTEIMIRTKGFLLCDKIIERIKNVNFGFAEILNFPELINYYAAKKIMTKLNGIVQFMHIASDEVVVLMTIPKDSH